MTLTIHCYEPLSVPRQVSLVLEGAKAFSLYAMQDTLAEDMRDMRSTVLRRIEENPPANCTLLFEMEMRASRAGELPTLRVLKVGGRADIQIIRPDSRGRVTKGTELKSGSRFEATLRDLRTVGFSLEIESESVHAKSALAGSRPTGSQAVAGVGSLIWVVPNILETIAEPRAKVVAFAVNRAKAMGLSTAMISPLLLMSGSIIVMGGVALSQYNEAATLEDRLAEIEAGLADAEAARDAALSSERECREQRRDLAKVLDRIEQSRKLQAEISLAVPLAHAVAIEGGGARMGNEDTMAWDEPAKASVHKVVVSQMASKKETDSYAGICLAQEIQLGQDLPRYMLTYHPSKDYLCPEDFQMVVDGVDVAGHFGLSNRVKKDFGPIVDSDGDPRASERWSSETLATGVREVVTTVLDADTGERPPVAPSQIHLWSLALFDAYNRMPSPAEGAMDRPATECIAEAIVELAGKYQPAEPGQPVLPDISEIASGVELRVTPSSGCPWPAASLNQGAQAALRASTNLALIQLALDEIDG